MKARIEKLFIYTPDQGQSVAKIFVCNPDENRINFFGHLFGIIEFDRQNKDIFAVLDKMAAEIEDIYYDFSSVRRTGIDIESHFEKSLKEINARLQTILTDNHLEKELEKLNIVIGAIKQDQLYFSYAKDIFGFLLYKTQQSSYRMADIIGNYKEQPKETKTDLLNIFSFTINGRVKVGEYLLFCNKSLVANLTLDVLKKSIIHNSPEAAVEALRNQLWQESKNTTFASVVVQNRASAVEHAPSAGKDNASQHSINTLLSTEDNTEKLLSMSLVPSIKKYRDLLKSIVVFLVEKFRVLGKYINGENLQKGLKKLQIRLSDATSQIQDRLWKKQSMLEIVKEKKPKLSVAKRNEKSALDAVREKIDLEIYTKKLSAFIDHLKEGLLHRRRITRKQMMKIGGFVLATVLLVIFVVNTFFLKQDQHDVLFDQQYNDQITIINERLDEVEAALIYNDKEKAFTIIEEISASVEKLPTDTAEKKAKQDELLSRIEDFYATIHNIILVEQPQMISIIPPGENSTLLGIWSMAGKTYVIDSANNIYTVGQKTLSKVVTAADINSPIRAHTVNTDKNFALFLHEDGKISRFSASANTFTAIPLVQAATEQKIESIALYGNRLYTLDASQNQIFRHSETITGYGLGNTWVDVPTTQLLDTRSLAIDGTIFALKENGSTVHLSSGTVTAFTTDSIEPIITQAERIWTSTESPFLYVLEPISHRVIVFQKSSGDFVLQYKITLAEGITDMLVNETTKEMIFISGNAVHSMPLQH